MSKYRPTWKLISIKLSHTMKRSLGWSLMGSNFHFPLEIKRMQNEIIKKVESLTLYIPSHDEARRMVITIPLIFLVIRSWGDIWRRFEIDDINSRGEKKCENISVDSVSKLKMLSSQCNSGVG